jgi:hypothetical protein
MPTPHDEDVAMLLPVPPVAVSLAQTPLAPPNAAHGTRRPLDLETADRPRCCWSARLPIEPWRPRRRSKRRVRQFQIACGVGLCTGLLAPL